MHPNIAELTREIKDAGMRLSQKTMEFLATILGLDISKEEDLNKLITGWDFCPWLMIKCPCGMSCLRPDGRCCIT